MRENKEVENGKKEKGSHDFCNQFNLSKHDTNTYTKQALSIYLVKRRCE